MKVTDKRSVTGTTEATPTGTEELEVGILALEVKELIQAVTTVPSFKIFAVGLANGAAAANGLIKSRDLLETMKKALTLLKEFEEKKNKDGN